MEFFAMLALSSQHMLRLSRRLVFSPIKESAPAPHSLYVIFENKILIEPSDLSTNEECQEFRTSYSTWSNYSNTSAATLLIH